MKLIQLTKGYAAIVDDEDYESLSRFNWSADSNGGAQVYAARKEGPRSAQVKITMHRFIMGMPVRPYLVDHINGNPLDNRRSNLRITDKRGNAQNSAKHKDASSYFKGVTWDKSRRKWMVQIVIDGVRTHLGRFAIEEDAARAYDEAAKQHFGEFARCNF